LTIKIPIHRNKKLREVPEADFLSNISVYAARPAKTINALALYNSVIRIGMYVYDLSPYKPTSLSLLICINQKLNAIFRGRFTAVLNPAKKKLNKRRVFF
jgi:hypothetical protein